MNIVYGSRRSGASNSNMFCKPSVVESHLCKLPYMENLCKLRRLKLLL